MFHTDYCSDFYQRLSERHQRITKQLGVLDRLILWLQSENSLFTRVSRLARILR
jgi:hypothetical protein